MPDRMELDPRLRASHSERSTSDGGSETPSPFSQLAPSTQPAKASLAPPPHGGRDRRDTPSALDTPQHSQHSQHSHSQPAPDQHGDYPDHGDDPDHDDPHGGRDRRDHHDGDPDANDPKRSRACEACRGLKVRCEPDPNDEGPCKRCKKAGRNCVVTAPTRKRQKKTDSRVAELEKKIDALTASLQSRTPAGSGPASAGPAHGVSPSAAAASSADEPSGYGMVWGNGATRHWSMTNSTAGGQPGSASTLAQQGPPRDQTPSFQPPLVMAGMKRKTSDRRDTLDDDRKSYSPAVPGPSIFTSQEGDIVDRGLLSMEKAAELFARYNDYMKPHLPAVIFPPSMTASELRRTKPMLFLAIMATAVSENHDLQRVLQKDVMTMFAQKVMMTGEKSLELVQAILVAVIWYWPPEHFEELKFYQLVHIAAVMAIDLGLGKKANRRANTPMAWRDHPFKRSPPPDPTSIESRRTWLACHFLSSNTAMALHRPHLIRWTPFMAESMDILETSPDAAPTDKYFCHLVWTHRLAEEVGSQFSTDDPVNVVTLSDARTQYALKAFERDLDKYKAAVPSDYLQPTLVLSFNVVSLYMHEMALHPDSMTEQFRPPFMTDALKDGIMSTEPLSAAHINSISACLKAIDGIFEAFLALDVTSTRCLPVFNFVRVAYAVVILLKMYFSASNAESELGKVISKDNMRVHYYLNALLEKFRATAADDKCRPAAKFLVVLAMLRSWFSKQGMPSDMSDTGRPNDDSPRPSPSSHSSHAQTPHQQHSASTPLHLLSEVAAGSDSTPRRGGLFATMTGIPQPAQPFFPDTSSSGGTPNPPPQQPMGAPPSLPPLAGPSDADLGAAMAPAFPPWVASGLPPDLGIPAYGGVGLGGDGMPLSPNAQFTYEGGARVVMNEPWFNDLFQGGLPDPNLFPF